MRILEAIDGVYVSDEHEALPRYPPPPAWSVCFLPSFRRRRRRRSSLAAAGIDASVPAAAISYCGIRTHPANPVAVARVQRTDLSAIKRRNLVLRSRATVLAVAAAVTVPAVAVAASTQISAPQLSVLAPHKGTVVKGNNVSTRVAISGWHVDGALAGKPPVPGVGHYHIHLDGRLVNAYGAPRASVSLQNVTAGKHALTLVLARNDHSELAGSEKTVGFRYKPSSALRTVGPATFSGAPSIRIVAPKAGAVVSGTVSLRAAVQNFNLSSTLFGKPTVSGYGHWHVFLDQPSMATMIAMTAGKTLDVSLKGVRPGKHKLIAVLADNLHAPVPGAMSVVTINVG